MSKVFEHLVSNRLGRFMERRVCIQKPSLIIGKVWVPVMHFCAFLIHCKVHWRIGSRRGRCRLISAQPLIGSIIREFCISSVVWVLEVLCCLYWHSFYQIDHSTLWWTVVWVNWLTSCQECRRPVFWALYCSSCTPRRFFSIVENKLIGYADSSTLVAVVPSPGVITVAESLSRDLVKVSEYGYWQSWSLGTWYCL